tara:strand:- start:2936 stop:3247 length:312 start_codon:yes stop_codon:yes gene_type:complete
MCLLVNNKAKVQPDNKGESKVSVTDDYQATWAKFKDEELMKELDKTITATTHPDLCAVIMVAIEGVFGAGYTAGALVMADRITERMLTERMRRVREAGDVETS